MGQRFTVETDWKYYSLVLLPFFFAAFAIWIFIIEGYLAKIYELEIIWALFPLMIWPPEFYQWLGIWLLIISMVFVSSVIILVRRAPFSSKHKTSRRIKTPLTGWRDWISGENRRLFYLTLAIFVLGNGIIATIHAFGLLDLSFIFEEINLYLSFSVWGLLGLLLLSISLIVVFLLAVSLRTSNSETDEE